MIAFLKVRFPNSWDLIVLAYLLLNVAILGGAMHLLTNALKAILGA
jgi:hypothetical protein